MRPAPLVAPRLTQKRFYVRQVMKPLSEIAETLRASLRAKEGATAIKAEITRRKG